MFYRDVFMRHALHVHVHVGYWTPLLALLTMAVYRVVLC